MQQIEEAKESLLVFLEANRDNIQQKVYNQFNVECIQRQMINQLNVIKMQKTIRQIFDFGSNQVYDYFFSHLNANILQYIKEQTSHKSNSDYNIIDIEKLTDIVRYCIHHGFIDPSYQPPIVVVPPIEPIIQKKPQKYKNIGPRYLANQPLKIQKPKQQIRVVKYLDEKYIQTHKKSMKQRLQDLFNYYCQQQKSLGQGPTFDRISHQGQTMNVGKFLQFCNTTQLFKQAKLPREQILSEFKRLSNGMTDIGFQTFQKVVQSLDKKYLQKLNHDSQNNPIPNYYSRLLLYSSIQLPQLKIQRNLTFGTRQKNQIQKKTKPIVKELTIHSGRFSQDLNLERRKRSPTLNERTNKQQVKKNMTVNLNDLNKLKLPKISWLQDIDQN